MAAPAPAAAAAAAPTLGTVIELRYATGGEMRLPSRSGTVWRCVKVKCETANPYQPKVVCKFCKLEFSGSAARIEEHVLGGPGKHIKKCIPHRGLAEPLLEEYKQLVKLLREAQDEKSSKKERKRAADASNSEVERASQVMRATALQAQTGGPLQKSLGKAAREVVDNAIADFVYGCNIDFNIASHPLWNKAVRKIQEAPPGYKPPGRNRMSNSLLHKRTEHYKSSMASLMPLDSQFGLTIVCDGWDQCDGEHLVNLLAVGRARVYFLRTIELTSTMKEDANAVADMIGRGILMVGPLNCVQVVTDTCTVMKAAWRIVESKFPWVSCSPCMPHVLNLLLKDISSVVSEVKQTINEGESIVSWFRNKKIKGSRWRRRFLKEITQAEMGNNAKSLMRAAPTRFCGYTYMLIRELDIKASLMRTVVSQQYMEKNFDDSVEGGDAARPIILSTGENSFWKRAELVKKITLPVIHQLRFFDTNLPTNGKVYKSMFMLVHTLNELDAVPKAWVDAAVQKAKDRWEYGHCSLHAAGYALDPEYHSELLVTGLDDPGLKAVKDGLKATVKRLALRLELLRLQPELKEPVLEGEMPELKATLGSPSITQRTADFFLEYGQYLSPTGPMVEDVVQINAKRMASAEFWSLHLGHLHHVAPIAKTILGQVACASHAERNWKAYGRIKTPSRAKLGHSKADQRVFLYNVLQQEHRVQDANYRPQVIEWDDVSSDETDEDV